MSENRLEEQKKIEILERGLKALIQEFDTLIKESIACKQSIDSIIESIKEKNREEM